MLWEVEDVILLYKFRDPNLLIEALTHSSYPGGVSYQRLEFLGDALLGNLFANFVFIKYQDLDPGRLSLIRAANISTENLARVAVRSGLYRHLRHNANALDVQIQDFVTAIRQEGEVEQFGGKVKAPKVLADIVESVAAAIYIDLNYDLKRLWDVFQHVLEPMVTKDCLHDQPVTVLYELCQKLGKQVTFEQTRRGSKNYATAYVDGKAVGSGVSGQKHTAKLDAARLALENLQSLVPTSVEVEGSTSTKGFVEIDGAKQKLLEFCGKGRSQKPIYRWQARDVYEAVRGYEAGLRPGLSRYTALLAVLAIKKLVDMAAKILLEMKAVGFNLDVSASDILIIYIKDCSVDLALRWFRFMEQRKKPVLTFVKEFFQGLDFELEKGTASIDKEEGPSHNKRFVCSVEMQIGNDVYVVLGEERARLKDAENSAASMMLNVFQDSKNVVGIVVE
ncbi:hypothetical protein GIB67_013695 [Kingdonia uniflora]|uniref:Uncharacterized protein n=1 Tax=Kingdonia uniflora TaxID=39325 RepID=A0A7J7NPZ6_9MAGN|nr:hypothetical protein GIB67_013695 [Kingdonia uniflora]